MSQYLTPAETQQLNEYVDNWTCVTEDGTILKLEEVGSSDFFAAVEELFGAQRRAQLCHDAYQMWAAV